MEFVVENAKSALHNFYAKHPEVDVSHGEYHALRVLHHATQAVASAGDDAVVAWGTDVALAVLLAALLHDVDDRKYFPTSGADAAPYPNARRLLASIDGVSVPTADAAIAMIALVSCSANGNTVPADIAAAGTYHLLIPRWADRLEAVGVIGVVRCYQYTLAAGQPLCSDTSPRATSAADVWALATPARFEDYQRGGGHSADMIAHYYDKLLHIARPPRDIVRNAYLEAAADAGAAPLVEVCVRYGRTGVVDEAYIAELEASLAKGQDAANNARP